MPTEDELVAIKERAAKQLLRLPGVNGVGLGGRVRGGERIQELVLKVYVTTKRPPDQLDPAELIPAQFEGIPTDVAELQPGLSLVQTQPRTTGAPWLPRTQEDNTGHDSGSLPLEGGRRIQALMSGSGFGTLGCMLWVKGDPSKVYALTNWHVVQGHTGTGANRHDVAPPIGTKVGQPDSKEGESKCCSHIFGTVAGGGYKEKADAAIVQLDPGTVYRASIFEIGEVKGSRNLTSVDAVAGTTVYKRWMRTSVTVGIVDSVQMQLPNSNGPEWTNLIVVQPKADPSVSGSVFFDEHGDSGSALLDENNLVVGLVFAMEHHPLNQPSNYDGPNGYPPLVVGYAFHIADVLALLETSVAGLAVLESEPSEAHTPRTVPGAAMAALPPELTPTLLGERAPVRAADAKPIRVPITSMGIQTPPAPVLSQLQRGLARSELGGALVTLWLSHQRELLALVNSNRRVATVWHRSGASALFQVLVRMLSQPDLELPRTLNGDPLSVCIDRVCASIERYASPALRDDLASVRVELPDLGGHNLGGLFSALGAT
jgi:hypothetical protein